MIGLNNTFDKKMLSRSEREYSELTEKIITGPEFEATRPVIEDNVSHNNESVYDHTLHIFARFQEFLTFDYLIDKNSKNTTINYFTEKVGRFTRAELFLLSSLLHDLGKTDTLVKNADGTTSASGHEKKSVEIAKEILEKLKFQKEEVSYMTTIVMLHSGYSLRFLKYLMNVSLSQLKTALGTTFFMPEVAMYMVADNESASTFSEYKEFLLNTILQEKNIYVSKNDLNDYKEFGTLTKEVMAQLKTTSKPWTLDTRLFHLSEEVGELHDIYLQYTGAKDREQTIVDMEIALNDVLLETLALYDTLGLDVSQALRNILKENGN